MLIAYVSDEYYTAIPDAPVEISRPNGEPISTRTSATGAIYVDEPSKDLEITLNCEGFAPKRVRINHETPLPLNIRLISKTLYGYLSPRWVEAGGETEVLVSSKSPHKAEIWSYGLQKKKIENLGFDSHPFGATLQNTPDGDYVGQGVGWKDGIRFTAPQKSGMYGVMVTNRDGESITLPLIVFPKKPSSKVAVLTSSITWSAYNNFGGRSNYVLATGLPDKPLLNRRIDLPRYSEGGISGEHETWNNSDYPPLSFARPEPFNLLNHIEEIVDDIMWRDACGLASAEWRTLGWLEGQGIDFDLYSEVQLNEVAFDLASYQVLVLNCHPEYWTREMYFKVKKWVHEDGGKLIYLGGNGINCEVRIDANGAVRVENGDYNQYFVDGKFRCFCQMPCDGEYRSRFSISCEPESRLLGIAYDRRGLMTGAPYEVRNEDHWIYRGTGLKNGELFGVNSSHTRCPGGASGHELDKMDDNSPANIELIAKGKNGDGSGAEMIYYTSESGGEVFSVGSINYPSSLNVDPRLSQITKNVFDRFLKD